MPYLPKDHLNARQAAFAEAFGKDLLPLSQAARVAGYADPNGEVDRLMARPAVVAKVVEYLRAAAVKWQVLVVKAKSTLLMAMDANLILKDGTQSDIPNMKMRVEAARIVLLTLKRDGAKLLEDAASDEDKAAESNIDLARRIVGAPPETPPETPETVQ